MRYQWKICTLCFCMAWLSIKGMLGPLESMKTNCMGTGFSVAHFAFSEPLNTLPQHEHFYFYKLHSHGVNYVIWKRCNYLTFAYFGWFLWLFGTYQPNLGNIGTHLTPLCQRLLKMLAAFHVCVFRQLVLSSHSSCVSLHFIMEKLLHFHPKSILCNTF